MQNSEPQDAAGKARWAGRIISALVVLFLLFDGIIKVIELPVVGETMQQLGYPAHLARGLGILTLVGAALYALPRTAMLGAIVLTDHHRSGLRPPPPRGGNASGPAKPDPRRSLGCSRRGDSNARRRHR